MEQICKFYTKPRTVNNGGYKKGRHIAWINLGVTEIEGSQENVDERWQSITDRLVIDDWSLEALLDRIEPSHLAHATDDELADILSAFGKAEDVESWKAIRKLQIQGYDRSDWVNTFKLGTDDVWFNKATRVGLVNSVTAEKRAGRESTVFWCGSNQLRLGVDAALEMLSQLELYALECYNVTANHIAAVERMDTAIQLKSFDIRADYPSLLIFSV